MVKVGSTVILRPYKTYKDEPEKNVEFIENLTAERRMLYFQALDHNRDPITNKVATGFYNLCILTSQELRAGDTVVIKSILGAKMFRMKRMLLVTIMERGEKKTTPTVIDGYTLGEEDF